MVSLVLLCSNYVALTLDQIREALDRAFPGEFLPQNERSFIVEGEEPGGPHLIKSLIQDAKGIFLFHNDRGQGNVDEEIDDERLRHITSSEHGWMSIDTINVMTTEADAFRFIAKALAQLAPTDAVYLLSPSEGPIVLDERVRRSLEAGRDPFADAE